MLGVCPSPLWDADAQTKIEAMRHVLRLKFTTNEECRRVLLSTGNSRLVESSKTDSFWACGKDGKGENVLGELLMAIREEVACYELPGTHAPAPSEANALMSRWIASCRLSHLPPAVLMTTGKRPADSAADQIPRKKAKIGIVQNSSLLFVDKFE